MLKNAKPSEHFIGAILRAYDKATDDPITCSELWDHIIMECFQTSKGFVTMFEWDESKAKSKNRIHTIHETIRRGHVPGLVVSERYEVTCNSGNE